MVCIFTLGGARYGKIEDNIGFVPEALRSLGGILGGGKSQPIQSKHAVKVACAPHIYPPIGPYGNNGCSVFQTTIASTWVLGIDVFEDVIAVKKALVAATFAKPLHPQNYPTLWI